ncbi:MAG TPA: right-handed parallel beta-helix repeat-containing protein [Candidatus Cloacimonetes bacterium]|nr:right-handed parallel beta-helix repeat-containing protein [Candidatus Cloacimonadota bacterium]HEX37745.1 right-handed parallel beta-helix repeat-containing protein [Candidatus Cloacimonadota bacterium]
MKRLSLFLFFLVYICFVSCSSKVEYYNISSVEELESIFEEPHENIVVNLKPGIYELSPEVFIDSTCANCQEPDEQIIGTRGLTISGKNIIISGPNDRSAIIKTNAGYGLYIKNLDNGLIENLTITSTIRDTAQMASNAAIVVSESSVTIQHTTIKENLGDSLLISQHISGVMGICGRENSDIKIIENDILCNSWDGIALFREAKAEIIGNRIDGIDKSVKRAPQGGRGVAIGITWNAEAVIKRNYIARYWKGIGIFVNGSCIIENNIVEDMVTWGIALWDADKGSPYARIENNLLYDLGACGISITKSAEDTESGWLVGNIVAKSGQNERYDSPDYYCKQMSLAMEAVPENFIIKDNLFFDNRRANDDLQDFDLPEEMFLKKLNQRKDILYQNPYFVSSKFYERFFTSQ